MKRDMDLIRELLLKLEALPMRPGDIVLLDTNDTEMQVDGYSTDQIDYHLALIREAQLIEAPGRGSMDGRITFRRLSWAGHDFLDSIRNPDVWAKTKAGALAAGGFTMELLRDLAKGFIKKQIEDRTGIKL
ncbi:hypothetical protein WK39_19155 [Burkholderia cepacia]|uniref:DUF2513 domain-containing protein n=1 Tax=Burkholderia cepacia TaxID=292 RepID=UPI000759BEB0|nr:DUF2513 domain-containing protein [Burkholderia cepacia]KVS55313.1 hypothetical protein WK40_30110 [Burkholderia cepacia]KVS56569.1 hypothetical protein WK39_19155 [Burkholderia cepacia]CAG9245673.1 conserved hypothetical protein [Burkholderia cepacia]